MARPAQHEKDLGVAGAPQQPCVGKFGAWFGHKFEGRWSTTEKPNVFSEPFTRATRVDAETSHELARHSTLTDRAYWGDICVRCGQVRRDA